MKVNSPEMAIIRLRQHIADTYSSGSVLPSIAELATVIDLNENATAKGLRNLAAEGVVELRAHARARNSSVKRWYVTGAQSECST